VRSELDWDSYPPDPDSVVLADPDGNALGACASAHRLALASITSMHSARNSAKPPGFGFTPNLVDLRHAPSGQPGVTG
jgi:hypothetical protein